jgi:hypothetical protein
MRGDDPKQEALFSYVSPERRVPQDHPLRPIREMVDGILKEMSPRFARLYAKVGGRRLLRSGCCGPCCCPGKPRRRWAPPHT